MVSLVFIPLSNIMGAVSHRFGIESVLLCLALWLIVSKAALSLLLSRLSYPPTAATP
jgi:hypothetical protein